MTQAKEQAILAQDARLRERMARIKYKILVMSGKGGVGKTTVSVNLAYALWQKHYKVGVLDTDLHGPNVLKMLGVQGLKLTAEKDSIVPLEPWPHFKAISLAPFLDNPDRPVIWRGPLKMAAIKQFLSDVQWGDLDFLIIDSPPGTGDEPLSVCQLIHDLDGALIVTTPQEVAILDSRKSVLFAKELKVPVLGIVENMSGFVCPHCGKEIDLFKKGGGEKAAQDLRVPFLGSIPLEGTIVKACDTGKPFVQAGAASFAPQAMRAIAGKIETAVTHDSKKI